MVETYSTLKGHGITLWYDYAKSSHMASVFNIIVGYTYSNNETRLVHVSKNESDIIPNKAVSRQVSIFCSHMHVIAKAS
jgi:hypothetical protein